MIGFDVALLAVAVLSGATASLTGFGIGSLLTPLLALRYGMASAIAAVALPHALATAVRCWRLRHAIDVDVVLHESGNSTDSCWRPVRRAAFASARLVASSNAETARSPGRLSQQDALLGPSDYYRRR